MKFTWIPIFFGTLMALVDIAMMGTIKNVSLGKYPATWGIPLAVGLYALEPLIFLKAMSFQGMVVTNLVWNMMSNIVVTAQGVLLFKESIKGIKWVGIGMSLVALTILSLADE
jgi:multidrug transporter EmrE-like cation transporter